METTRGVALGGVLTGFPQIVELDPGRRGDPSEILLQDSTRGSLTRESVM